MNKFVVTGNLTKDAELNYSQNGKPYCKFTLANNEGYGDNKKTNFFNCTLWGKGGESLSQYLTKGKKIVVSGSVNINTYEKDGEKKNFTEVVVDMYNGIEFMGGGQQQERPDNNTSNDYVFGDGNFEDDITPVDDEDMPF